MVVGVALFLAAALRPRPFPAGERSGARIYLMTNAEHTPEIAYRISVHESGHALKARALGLPVGAATIIPGDGYLGRVTGPDANSQLEARAIVAQAMLLNWPGPGETTEVASPMIAHALARIVELAAGTAAEKLIFPGTEPFSARQDRADAEAFAQLVCRSRGSVDALLSWAAQEASLSTSQNTVVRYLL